MEIFKKKIKTIYQSESAECGLACLTMILNYFGKDYSLSDMRDKYYTSLDGASLKDIIDISNKEELIALGYEVEEEDLLDIKTPCIAYWQNNHFVIIEKITKKNIEVIDPETGRYTYPKEEFINNFSNVICEFEKTDKFVESNAIEKKKKFGKFDFLANVKDFKLNFTRIFIMSFCLEFFIMLIPLFNQIVIDGIVIENNKELLFSIGIGFIFIILFKSLSEFIRDHMLLFFSNHLQINFKYNLLDKLLKLPVSFFEKRGYSNILSRFESLEEIKYKLSNGLLENLVGGIAIFITGSFMYYLNELLTYIVISTVLLIFLIKLIYYKRFEDITKLSIEEESKEQAFLTEILKTIETIKVNGEENKIFKKWYSIFLHSTKSSAFLDKMYINVNVVDNFLVNLQRLLVVWLGAHYILNEETTIGVLFAFFLYQIIFTEKILSFVDNIFNFRLLILHLDRINEIKEEKEEKYRLGNNNYDIEGKIELKNVYFRHNKNENYLFEDLNLTINKGESVVLTGESGIGKTTLLRILTGLVEIEKGQILIDDIDLRDIGLNNYRKNIGVVLQNEDIFSNTIKENITLFDEKIDISKFNEVIEKTIIKNDIEKLKMKEETILGEYGAILSSGQIQRLMLARALYRNPKILFLDEAMSNLDEKMEIKIVENLKEEKITKISIAHREESKKLADRVINVEEL